MEFHLAESGSGNIAFLFLGSLRRLEKGQLQLIDCLIVVNTRARDSVLGGEKLTYPRPRSTQEKRVHPNLNIHPKRGTNKKLILLDEVGKVD